MVPAVGEVIAGRYRLEEQIGGGVMGSVWRATHTGLKKAVAVKMMSPAMATDQRLVERFNREAVLAAKIRSDHVVRVDDHGIHEGVPFMVMEYLRGETLRRLLNAVGRLELRDTAEIVRQVCRALSAAHEVGLVHRDIRPENILVGQTEIEGEYRIRVVDFGHAKASDTIGPGGLDPTRTGDIVGAPHYLSPEQARGESGVGPAADLWSLAVVAFECLTGERPFRAPSIAPLILAITQGEIPLPSDQVDDLPEAIDSWFQTLLNRDPAARFATARAASRAFHLAAGVEERTSSAGVAPGLSSFDSFSAMKTIRIDEQSLTDGERTFDTMGLGRPPMPSDSGEYSAPEGSDAAETIPNMAGDLADVDRDMAQLPPGRVAMPQSMQLPSHSEPHPPQVLPQSNVYPSAPQIPPPMRVPAQPGPPSVQVRAPVPMPSNAADYPSWDDPASPPPMEKSRVGLWIGAILMVLIGGGVAAFLLGPDLFGGDEVAGSEDDGDSPRKSKKKKRNEESDETSPAEASTTEPSPEPAPTEPTPDPSPEPAPAEGPPPESPPAPSPEPAPEPPPTRPSPAPPQPPVTPKPKPPQPKGGSHRRTLE